MWTADSIEYPGLRTQLETRNDLQLGVDFNQERALSELFVKELVIFWNYAYKICAYLPLIFSCISFNKDQI